MEALDGALAENLRSVILYGSAARGAWTPRSDIDLLIVLDRATRAALESIAEPVKLARWSARVECMIVEEGEIARAADALSIFYEDVQRHHVVLRGTDPFGDLVIHAEHLRLQLEEELRRIGTRLRRDVLDTRGDDTALRGASLRKAKNARSALAALLRVLAQPVDDDGLEAVLRAAGATLGVDVGAVLGEEGAAAHDALAALLDRAIEEVDSRAEDAP